MQKGIKSLSSLVGRDFQLRKSRTPSKTGRALFRHPASSPALPSSEGTRCEEKIMLKLWYRESSFIQYYLEPFPV